MRRPVVVTFAPLLALLAVVLVAFVACKRDEPVVSEASPMPKGPLPADRKLATFGGGCFWCAEAIFRRVDGVLSVESGFAGGIVEKPTYHQVCDGDTGHAEVVQIAYDPKKVRYDDLLEIFWKTHDPTTLNRQGDDVGTQYRSIILFHDDEQRKTAESIKGALDASGAFKGPIVTQIVPFTKFWKAEDYHQDYFALNADNRYCRYVVAPKVEKFERVFKDRLRK
jgi:peptide-methionine (S)-S-oxide reductase